MFKLSCVKHIFECFRINESIFFQNMRAGITKDIRRQEMRKIQNLKQLQDQQELTKILTKLRDEDR